MPGFWNSSFRVRTPVPSFLWFIKWLIPIGISFTFVIFNVKLSTFFLGSHIPRPRSYRHRNRARRGGYCLRIQKSFKKSMWVLTSELEFLFTPQALYHRRSKKRCSFKTQTIRRTIVSLCVPIKWCWDFSNARIHRIQSIYPIPHQWLWTEHP